MSSWKKISEKSKSPHPPSIPSSCPLRQQGAWGSDAESTLEGGTHTQVPMLCLDLHTGQGLSPAGCARSCPRAGTAQCLCTARILFQAIPALFPAPSHPGRSVGGDSSPV